MKHIKIVALLCWGVGLGMQQLAWHWSVLHACKTACKALEWNAWGKVVLSIGVISMVFSATVLLTFANKRIHDAMLKASR